MGLFLGKCCNFGNVSSSILRRLHQGKLQSLKTLAAESLFPKAVCNTLSWRSTSWRNLKLSSYPDSRQRSLLVKKSVIYWFKSVLEKPSYSEPVLVQDILKHWLKEIFCMSICSVQVYQPKIVLTTVCTSIHPVLKTLHIPRSLDTSSLVILSLSASSEPKTDSYFWASSL